MTNRFNILHHGAVNGVTGSAHELVLDEQNSLLIDCGLFQGSDSSPGGGAHADNLDIDFPVHRIRALIVTHVHIDHVGRIPWLLAAASMDRSCAARPPPACCRSCWRMPSGLVSAAARVR
jgi:Cft2 family RNA processing exonuclease